MISTLPHDPALDLYASITNTAPAREVYLRQSQKQRRFLRQAGAFLVSLQKNKIVLVVEVVHTFRGANLGC